MQTIARHIESIFARIAVTMILCAVAAGVAAARVLRWPIDATRGRRPAPQKLRVMLVGTFYNDAWFDAHVAPLIPCECVDRVIVVTDRPLRSMPGVEYAIPRRGLVRACGRTLARAICVAQSARRERSDLLVGYHIMPNALVCLLVARLLGRRAAYQMTGGPVQLFGGGVGSENTLLRRQRRPGPVREALMHHLARQFDLIVVRGARAAEYVERIRPRGRMATIPAGIDTVRFAPSGANPRYDLISVGRLVPVKRYDRLIDTVAALSSIKPDVRCAIVGDGPELEALRQRAEAAGVSGRIDFLGRRDDIAALLNDAGVFVLTSETEGQSIAMMEAMAAGLPVAAPDVGELCDLVEDGVTGLVIDADRPKDSAERIGQLLADDARRARFGEAARRAVVDFAATDAVAERWGDALQDFVASTSSAKCAPHGKSQLGRKTPVRAATVRESLPAETRL